MVYVKFNRMRKCGKSKIVLTGFIPFPGLRSFIMIMSIFFLIYPDSGIGSRVKSRMIGAENDFTSGDQVLIYSLEYPIQVIDVLKSTDRYDQVILFPKFIFLD